jgi:hypothetical protein
VPVLDYHQKVLCPDVWDATEQSLSPRASVQIDEQVGDRFPNATAVYIVGDMTGHYWNDESDLDLLVRVSSEDLPEYREHANAASGYKLTNTDHKVNFFLIPSEVPPEDIARNFGLLYDLSTGTWIGQKNWGATNELSRPAAIIAYTNWQLFKAKHSLEVDPYDWKVLLEAFRELTPEDRGHVVKTFQGRVVRLKNAVDKHLQGEPKESWKQTEELEDALQEGETDLSSEFIHLAKPLLYAVLHAFRYGDLLDTLKQADEVMARNERTASALEPEQQRVVAKQDPDTGEQTNYWKRIDLLITRICQARGGFKNSEDSIVEIFGYILEGNKFIKTRDRQRRIARRIYDEYYRGSGG